MVDLPNIDQKHQLNKILILCFFIILVLLIGQTSVNVKDINDTWILEGLFPLFLLFTIVYAAIAVFASDLKLLTIITSSYLGTINLIPHLKYVFIYGFHDSLGHYAQIREFVVSGHIPKVGYYADQYQYQPGSHILASELSVVTGLGPLLGMKLFLAISPFLIPFAAYLVLKRSNMPVGMARAILIAIPIVSPILYRYTGTIAVYPLYFFFISLILSSISSTRYTRSEFVATTLIGIAIIISHDVTSFFLTTCLLSLLFFIFFMRKVSPQVISVKGVRSFHFVALVFVFMNLTHFVLISDVNFSRILLLIKQSIEGIFGGGSPGAVEYYGGFFELTLMEKFNVLAVRLGKDIISVFLSILAPLAIFKLKLRDDRLKSFYRFLVPPAFLAISVLLLTQFIRPHIMNRGLFYFGAFSPFLVGTTIFWLIQLSPSRIRKLMTTTVFLCLISISIVSIFPCQPLIPTISTSSGDCYVLDLRAVNSVYKRSMIYFIDTFNSRSSIATDTITRTQIYGIANSSIQDLFTLDDPISENVTARLILVSFDGGAHIVISGENAIAYFLGVQNAIEQNSIIYTNGKSYVLQNFESD